MTPEDSGVPFRVRNFPPTGRGHSGRLGLKHETILSERIETAGRRKNVFENGRIDRTRKGDFPGLKCLLPNRDHAL